MTGEGKRGKVDPNHETRQVCVFHRLGFFIVYVVCLFVLSF